MDRGKVSVAAPYLPAAATPSTEWLMARLDAYWRALGVRDPNQINALSEQALRHANDSPQASDLDATGRALMAAGEVLDDWLARALDLARPSRELTAARAALLSGVAPDWPAALFAAPGEADDLMDSVRVAIAEPTPPPKTGVMPAQRINLFRLLAPLFRLWRMKLRG